MEKYSICFLFLFILGQINELLQKIKRVKGKKYIFVSYKNKNGVMREEEKLMSEQNKNKKVLVVIEPSILLFYIFY